jgi:hypothetical protein
VSKQGEDASKGYRDLVAFVVDYAAREYDDQWKTFTALDAKAQGTAAVGGILIAALVTLSGRDSFIKVIEIAGAVVLVPLMAAIVFVFASLVLSLYSVLVQQMEKPYDTEVLRKYLDDVSALPADQINEELISRFYNEVVDGWQKRVKGMDAVLERKADGLRVAQIFLFAALLIAVVVLCVMTTAA